jgi:hypothetical protein
MDLAKIVEDVKVLVVCKGWRVRETRVASTGSVYLDIVRDGTEWCVIRVADHKRVYERWLITYSLAPGDLWWEELEEILDKPFGEVGDIL